MLRIHEDSGASVALHTSSIDVQNARRYHVILYVYSGSVKFRYDSRDHLTFGEAMEVMVAVHHSKSNNRITIPYMEEHFNTSL